MGQHNTAFVIALIAVTSVFDTVRELWLKAAINELDLHVDSLRKMAVFLWRLALVPVLWLAFLFSVASLVLWLFVLSKADLNFAFSLDSMHYVFIALASRLFLGEKVGFARWAGTILIVIGISLVAASG